MRPSQIAAGEVEDRVAVEGNAARAVPPTASRSNTEETSHLLGEVGEHGRPVLNECIVGELWALLDEVDELHNAWLYIGCRSRDDDPLVDHEPPCASHEQRAVGRGRDPSGDAQAAFASSRLANLSTA